MTTYHRWFILPIAETDDGVSVKYTDDDRLGGFASAGPFSRQQVEDGGYDHLLAYNDAEEWRVTLCWGEGDDGWNALNEIHANYHDTETLADHDQDVEPVLVERFGEDDWSRRLSILQESENTA